MKINFYEEFPTEKNLSKINLVKFPTTLIIAAKSWKHFHTIKKNLTNKKNLKLSIGPQ